MMQSNIIGRLFANRFRFDIFTMKISNAKNWALLIHDNGVSIRHKCERNEEKMGN